MRIKPLFHWLKLDKKKIEKKRIKFHLKRVELELLRKDVSNLSEKMKIERRKKIDLLHEYWTREEFPKNTQYPKKRLPHIRDSSGVPCAMAYIIEKSGNSSLVDQLETENNLVYIKDVNEGPLIDWLSESGITKKEAQRIQPTYGESVLGDHGFSIVFFSFFGLLGGLGFLNYKWIQRSKSNKSKIAKAVGVSFAILVFSGLAVFLIIDRLIGWMYIR